MKVVFRVDSSAKIGSGHLMRCLTLAEALRDKSIYVRFICRDLMGSLIELLNTRMISVTMLPSSYKDGEDKLVNDPSSGLEVSQAEDAAQTIEALGGVRPDWLIVDQYCLDAEWERELHQYVGHLMVIDDLANRKHECDVLLDQNYFLNPENRYADLGPPSCIFLLGPQYALLRKEFEELRLRFVKKKSLNRVLVFLTSGDDQGATLKAMEGIDLYGKINYVDIVVGKANLDISSIRTICQRKNWNFHCQIDYLPTLIAEADLVIGAGGSSNWERCALGVPALVVTLAENQVDIARSLDSLGVVINLGWHANLHASDYAKALNSINEKIIDAMSQSAFELVDAKGAQKVVSALLSIK